MYLINNVYPAISHGSCYSYGQPIKLVIILGLNRSEIFLIHNIYSCKLLETGHHILLSRSTYR